jgi:AcrR family transcriptional regulator
MVVLGEIVTKNSSVVKSKRGRRVGDSNSRQLILYTARAHFAKEGYANTTIRKVASAAGVDPALVIQFFHSKDQLFSQAMTITPASLEKIVRSIQGPTESVGERLIIAFWEIWEGSPEHSEPFLAMFRAAASNEMVADQIRDLIQARLVEVIHPELSLTSKEGIHRVGLAVSMLVGIFVGRTIIKVPAIADLTRDEILKMVRDPIQLLLTSD